MPAFSFSPSLLYTPTHSRTRYSQTARRGISPFPAKGFTQDEPAAPSARACTPAAASAWDQFRGPVLIGEQIPSQPSSSQSTPLTDVEKDNNNRIIIILSVGQDILVNVEHV